MTRQMHLAILAAYATAFFLGAMLHLAYRLGEQHGAAQATALYMGAKIDWRTDKL